MTTRRISIARDSETRTRGPMRMIHFSLSFAASVSAIRTPKAQPVSVQIDGGDEPIVVETTDGEVRARTGTVPHPDVRITGSPALTLALLLGKVSLTKAKTAGLKFKGNVKVLNRLRVPDTR